MENGRFPNKLKKYRRCAGYSQKTVARLLGLADTSLISRWEKGKSVPNMMQAFRLSRIYDTLPQVLFEALWMQCVSDVGLLTQEESFSTKESFYV